MHFSRAGKAQVKLISLMRAEVHQLSQLAMTVRPAQLSGMQSGIMLSTLPALFLLWQANISSVTKVYCGDLSLHWLKLTQPYSESVTSDKIQRERKQRFEEEQLGSAANSGVACLKVTFCLWVNLLRVWVKEHENNEIVFDNTKWRQRRYTFPNRPPHTGCRYDGGIYDKFKFQW